MSVSMWTPMMWPMPDIKYCAAPSMMRSTKYTAASLSTMPAVRVMPTPMGGVGDGAHDLGQDDVAQGGHRRTEQVDEQGLFVFCQIGQKAPDEGAAAGVPHCGVADFLHDSSNFKFPGSNLSVTPAACHCPGCGSQHLLRPLVRASHPAGRGPNSDSLFPPLAAVVVVALARGGLGIPENFISSPEAPLGRGSWLPKAD